MYITTLFSFYSFTTLSSTKNIATVHFGQGIGMDDVKTNMKKLGGDDAVDSELGERLLFKITILKAL